MGSSTTITESKIKYDSDKKPTKTNFKEKVQKVNIEGELKNGKPNDK